MNIVLATTLYPPDIEEPAPYTKELARRLAGRGNMVTVVTYGRIPEALPGVTVVTVNKRRPLPVRLVAYTYALWRAAKNADVVYAQNGASVELPLVILSFKKTNTVLHIGDARALEHTKTNALLRAIHRLAAQRAHAVVNDRPLPRPEVLPFDPPNLIADQVYRRSWENHLENLLKYFDHA